MKPVLTACPDLLGNVTYTIRLPFEDGREARCDVARTDQGLQYRYIVSTPGEPIASEQEYHSPHTLPKKIKEWEQMPESERGPAPKGFKDSDLFMALATISRIRRVFCHQFHLPTSGEELMKIPVPTGPGMDEPLAG